MGKKKLVPWTVYIIETDKGYLYTGITTDLVRRFSEHQSSKKGAKYFRGHTPVRILYTESYKNRSLATKRELAIKKLPRKNKLKLIKDNT